MGPAGLSGLGGWLSPPTQNISLRPQECQSIPLQSITTTKILRTLETENKSRGLECE